MKRPNKLMAARQAVAPKSIAYPDLPISERREELLATIRDHQVVIVAGETGSGKSTQLPKLCLELGRGIAGMIGHTQPRRIAARSIAERVAEELNSKVGELVGFKVRFTDQVSDGTLIKVMTDGILLNEIHSDRKLNRYDTIILDEAHERGLNTDFLIGYLKALLPTRPDLKLIITSATIDTGRFSEHFDNAPVVEVSGRTYPVEVRYRPLDDPDAPVQLDQPEAIAEAVRELSREGTGDVLVFVSGEREIRDAVAAIDELRLPHTETLPLFGRLSSAEQHRVFSGHTGRRVIVSTNVAETSLTVPGIRYVVDAGTARISRYSKRTKVQQLPIEPVSQASANQRAGRCGRLGPGICIRLYSEDDLLEREEFTEPEIQRTNLASVMLQMAALDLGRVDSFPFLDAPDSRSIRDGIALLEELGAVDPDRRDTNRWLTQVGRRLSLFPLDPRLGRMLLAGSDHGCLADVLVIVSALSIQDPRERPLDHRERADQLHARFRHPTSDFLSWLNLWTYIGDERKARSSNQFRKMCRDEFLNYRRIREWQDIHSQLRRTVKQIGLTINRKPADPEPIHLALLTGLLSHIGMKDPDGHGYRGARNARFSLSPGSVLFKKGPQWLMAAELVETTRMWAHQAVAIEPEWVEQVGSHLTSRTVSDPWWDAERGEAVANETVTIFGLPLVSGRTVGFGHFDAAESRELFILHALVGGEWDVPHRFVANNAATVAQVLEREERERRRDLLADDEDIATWFDQRIPPDVFTVAAFNRWWRDVKHENPTLLEFSTEDITAPEVEGDDSSAFPKVWSYGDVELPLDYAFDPASDTDGVTIDVYVGDLDRLDPAAFDWHVPGYRAELIEALIRSLPKQLRTQFVPIRETVASVVDDLDPSDGGLVESLRRTLSRIADATLPIDAFDLDRLPPHLRPRFRVIDDDGVVLGQGEDLAVIKDELVAETRSVVSSQLHPLERTGSISWDFGELPVTVELEGDGHRVTAYVALVDEGSTVGVRIVATPQEQGDAMWAGTRRLLLLQLTDSYRHVEELVTADGRLAIAAGPHGSVAGWLDDCMNAAVDRLVEDAGGPVFSPEAFDDLLTQVRLEVDDAVIDLASGSLEVLDAVRTLNIRMETAVVPDETLIDIIEQRDRLIYPGFVASLGFERLADVQRYIAAMERRLIGARDNPQRDLELLSEIQSLEAEQDRLIEHLGMSPQLAEVDWMLQELRVSYFAQQLGTKFKVSEKRIRAALADVAAV
ncbi:MAG: ATP-dependent RNA helicase HrpA [Acidimicrobiia bacterium]|nr:ATP-dependent RNA helicase HrpA [Acidimicrobiia bacterium]